MELLSFTVVIIINTVASCQVSAIAVTVDRDLDWRTPTITAPILESATFATYLYEFIVSNRFSSQESE